MLNWFLYLLAVEIPLPGLGILVTILLFLLLHGGILIWNLATLKSEVKNLGGEIKRLDTTLQTMAQYDVRLALVEQSSVTAHKRIDTVITKLNVHVPIDLGVRDNT